MDIKFSHYLGRVEELNLPKSHQSLAANLVSAIREIEASGSVPEGLEDVVPTTYTIQPLKASPTGDLIIYKGKGEPVSLGKAFKFYPLKTTVYKVVWDEEQNRVRRRIYSPDVNVALGETEALYIVRAIFGVTHDLSHFFILEGLRSKRNTIDQFIDELAIAAKQNGAHRIYELIGEAKLEERTMNGKKFKTYGLEVVGAETDKHTLELLSIAYDFVSDYIEYRRKKSELAATVAQPEASSAEEAKGEAVEEEVIEELNKF